MFSRFSSHCTHNDRARQRIRYISGNGQPDLNGRLGRGHHLEALEGELLNGDYRDDRGLFNGVDKFIGQRWQHHANGLGQDNQTHGLPPGETECVACFPLSGIDCLNTGPNNFGNIGTLEDTEGDCPERKGRKDPVCVKS